MEREDLADSNKKQEILSAATKLFYAQGYDFTSTRQLAKSVNMSIAGVYYHFKDKEEILFLIIDKAITNLHEALLEAIIPGENPQTNLQRIIKNIVGVVYSNKMALFLLFREDHRLNKDQLGMINKKRRAGFDLIRQELANLKQEGKTNSFDLTVATFSFFALTIWPFLWFDPGGPLDVERLSSEITELFFKGILSRN